MQKLTENQYDIYSKQVLRFKLIAARILMDTVDEFKSLSLNEIIEILNKENTENTMNILNTEDIINPNAKLFYDLLVHIQHEDGIFVDFEPQGRISNMNAFIKRCIHTKSRMIVWQRNEPGGSNQHDFSDLKKCISIWIVLNPPKKCRGTITKIKLTSENIQGTFPVSEKPLETERIIILCLHNQIDVNDTSALMMLSILFSNHLSRQDRVLYLKKYYDIVLTEAEREVLDHMCNAHEGVLEYGKEIGMKKGLKKGMERGMKEGMKEGMKKKSLEIAKSMIADGAEFSLVSRWTSLSMDECRKLKESLN